MATLYTELARQAEASRRSVSREWVWRALGVPWDTVHGRFSNIGGVYRRNQRLLAVTHDFAEPAEVAADVNRLSQLSADPAVVAAADNAARECNVPSAMLLQTALACATGTNNDVVAAVNLLGDKLDKIADLLSGTSLAGNSWPLVCEAPVFKSGDPDEGTMLFSHKFRTADYDRMNQAAASLRSKNTDPDGRIAISFPGASSLFANGKAPNDSGKAWLSPAFPGSTFGPDTTVLIMQHDYIKQIGPDQLFIKSCIYGACTLDLVELICPYPGLRVSLSMPPVACVCQN